ncbi:MAG: sn-glycerol-3-phosphate ABC transporter ATP-binding protein UgpC [Ignavibacteriaceae bacterium]|nr:sn-glycerol-3-phosphate ABC transporter ATP-binding protein UgpC [Ignavibacterium sp.]MCC6254320.1 sn-glycerol-3-phosphate ABC transporter ATP-binding protein UgpC [Ignavibacteriaceae bacterium]HMN23354.1 sn-glycerol-3-phosphate ABC transporter ATP-binding protein UgpC [Ignavibacteriaceae bacterium]HRN26721.1 sn-glycerol-3-phosphate ABC transporter ATP-binding protein UgpC [Ignavibacteriaceae bacterium]HRP93010.1 sn-glycerol-3-phosphate ABC transporter ATP-binding protein UgpC [Ignavibacteri
MAEVLLKNVSKIFDGGNKVVTDANFTVNDKEFVVLVGPSGCGKTTTLRMVAGLEEITSGEIYIDGKLVNNLPPKDRDIAMVFQNYALYPHMTVYENMAFGLKLKKVDKKEIDSRVKEAAKILSLEEYLDRKPKALSGGQRQRVAVGRAIVRKPKVFLFDEPLSNLDAKLRVQMRTEISKLHKQLGATMIYVTHDQTEAMTMGDRIVIMKDGIINQVDAPMNLYNKPINKFVAGFIGSPSMNFIDVSVNSENKIISKDGKLIFSLSIEQKNHLKEYLNKEIILGIRPEDIRIESDSKNSIELEVLIDVIEPMGNETFIYFEIEKNPFIARVKPIRDLRANERIKLYIDPMSIYLFNKNSGINILQTT